MPRPIDLSSHVSDLEGRMARLLPSQRAYIFAPEKYSNIASGFASGKTRALVMKGLVLSSLIPKNRGLLGRRTATDLDASVVPVFKELCPDSWIKKLSLNAKNPH